MQNVFYLVSLICRQGAILYVP